MTDYDIMEIIRMSRFCGDCKRNFDDCEGDHCYMRIAPARLICLDCKLKEQTPHPKRNDK